MAKLIIYNVLFLISSLCLASFMVHMSIFFFYDLVIATMFWMFFGIMAQINLMLIFVFCGIYIRKLRNEFKSI